MKKVAAGIYEASGWRLESLEKDEASDGYRWILRGPGEREEFFGSKRDAVKFLRDLTQEKSIVEKYITAGIDPRT